MAMQYPTSFKTYVMEPKGFMGYHEKGIAHAVSNSLPIVWTKIIQPKVFTKYPHEGILLFLDLSF
jgi:hypothetical protein